MNCQICFENYNDTKVKPYSITPCGHTFCLKCLDNLIHSTPNKNDLAKCPKCRIPIIGKLMNFAILDVLDLNLIPDSNVGLKKNIQKSLHELQESESTFFPAYEAKTIENKDRIKQLKDEINSQTIDLINQIKQNRVSLFKTADQIEALMNESLNRYLTGIQQLQLGINEFTTKLKNMNQYERSELNTFKDEIDKLKLEFDTNMHEMKSCSFKLEFKKFSINKPNFNFIGEIIHEKPVVNERRREKTSSTSNGSTMSRSYSTSRIDKLDKLNEHEHNSKLVDSNKLEKRPIGTAPVALATKPHFSLACKVYFLLKL